MTPWVVRNFEISGRFVPTMTVTGLAIFQGEEAERNAGNGEDSKDLLNDAAEEQLRIGHEMGLRMREDFFPQFYRVQDEIAFYDELGRRGWTQYREHPALLARAIVHNCWAFWFQGRTYKATLINIIVMLPFILIFLCGAVVAVRRERRSWILVISVVMYVLPHLVIIAVARYSAAVVPLMCVLAACILFLPALRHLMFRDPRELRDWKGSKWPAPIYTSLSRALRASLFVGLPARGDAHASVPPFAFALTFLAVIASFTISGNTLNVLGTHYADQGGNPLLKIHPATYLAVMAAIASLVSGSSAQRAWICLR